MGEGVSAEARRRARDAEAGPKDHVRARRMLARIAGGGDSRARGRGRTVLDSSPDRWDPSFADPKSKFACSRLCPIMPERMKHVEK